jgi:hypothetical protein
MSVGHRIGCGCLAALVGSVGGYFVGLAVGFSQLGTGQYLQGVQAVYIHGPIGAVFGAVLSVCAAALLWGSRPTPQETPKSEKAT